MKMFIKTVCITLCISVTTLFFSSYKRVEAVAEGLIVSSVSVAIGAIVSYICSSVADYINSSFDSLSSEIITDLKWDKMEKDRIAAEATQKVNVYLNSPEYRQKIMEQLKPSETVSEYPISKFIDAQAYFSSIASPNTADRLGYAALLALENSTQTITIDTVNDKCTLNNPLSSDIVSSAYNSLLSSSGAAAGSITGISSAISNVNGKPQKVTTTYTPTKVEIFDYLELQYTTFNRITDFELSFTALNASKNRGYYLPYFILNNTLYVPVVASSPEALSTAASPNSFNFAYKSAIPYYYFQGFTSVISNLALVYPDKGDASCGSVSFAEVGNSLCVASYYYNANSGRSPSQYQYIIGFPDEPTSYPILFDTPSDSYTGKLSSTSTNYGTSNTYIFFVNAADRNDYFYGDVALSLDVDCAGYFKSSSSSIFDFSSTIGTAGKMLSGTVGSAVTGGEKTTYSELSDIEKAIYALAQQQGITYEEMLKQCNIMINENGEIYLESLDGVTKSIDSLLAEFEKLLEQGDISNEQGAAAVEQLIALLNYLKSLNIEGLSSYIASIEATLDGLNQRDEDQSALLGDVVGQLQGLNDYLNSLGIEDIGSDIKSLTSSVTNIISSITEGLFDSMTSPKANFDYSSGDIIEHYTEQFPLFEQCKKLLNKLFNYDDVLQPPNFSFYWDSDGDGVQEIYNPLDLSFLETKLTNENLVDKSLFSVEIKIIDLIRYTVALIIYGLYVMRLIKRLPSLYGSGPFASL